jgi:hypothetical protein
MPKYIITEERLVRATWTYEVEAENEQDALEQVFTGKAEEVNYEIEDNGDASDSRFDITEK